MNTSVLKTSFKVFGIFAIILTLMPFVAVNYWWIRMFDFPHLQLTFLTSLAILLYVIRFDFRAWQDYAFIAALIACVVFQFTKIYPYTAFSDYEVLETTQSSSLKFYTANVHQKNKETSELISQIDVMDADVMLFTEVNTFWQSAISKQISKDYKYQIEFPLSNTYGMALYSKLPLVDSEVRFLVNDSIPSIHTKVEISPNNMMQIYAIHPTPPMPQENPMSTDRDSEMMQIAFLARESKLPIVVIGDFNDVAWSQTSKLFQRVSGLLDLRKGRGLFNTYSAKSYILRWPLDHVFVSEEFRHVAAKTGKNINSDHFPFYAELSFEPNIAEAQSPKPPSDEDLKNAKKQALRGKLNNKN
ncbi:MAG: endonuclease/exonuclease/phosphatase family protein [Algicola sp.]|nr:endonuclease/exonuclease/phosphatase family protein [Algicola sp.]